MLYKRDHLFAEIVLLVLQYVLARQQNQLVKDRKKTKTQKRMAKGGGTGTGKGSQGEGEGAGEGEGRRERKEERRASPYTLHLPIARPCGKYW